MKKYFDSGALIMIIVGQIISIVLEASNENKNLDNILTSSITIVFALFCISVYFEMISFRDKLSNEVYRIQCGSNIANTKSGKGSDEFYGLALEYMGASHSSIWLTSLNDKNPNVKGSIMRNKYFSSVFPFAKKNKNVEVRRVVKIATEEKLDWVKEQIESTKNLENVSIAYIEQNIKILNVQIFDEGRMLLWNPGQAKVSQQHNKFIYSENVDIVEMFAEYYENIWQDLQRNCGGFIIKEGNHYDNNEINNKLQIIKDKMKMEG